MDGTLQLETQKQELPNVQTSQATEKSATPWQRRSLRKLVRTHVARLMLLQLLVNSKESLGRWRLESFLRGAKNFRNCECNVSKPHTLGLTRSGNSEQQLQLIR